MTCLELSFISLNRKQSKRSHSNCIDATEKRSGGEPAASASIPAMVLYAAAWVVKYYENILVSG